MRYVKAVLAMAVAASLAVASISAAAPEEAAATVKLNATCLTPEPLQGDDILFDVRIENASGKGMEVPICEEMQMCCVPTMHPTISCKRCGGVSLRDGCKEGTEPVARKSWLPDGAQLCVKARVPCRQISQTCLADPENRIELYWVMECPDGSVARSNTLLLAGKE